MYLNVPIMKTNSPAAVLDSTAKPRRRPHRRLLSLWFAGLLVLTGSCVGSFASSVGSGGGTAGPCPLIGDVISGGEWYSSPGVLSTYTTTYLGNCTNEQKFYTQSGGGWVLTDDGFEVWDCIGCSSHAYDPFNWADFPLAVAYSGVVLAATNATYTFQITTPVAVAQLAVYNLSAGTLVATYNANLATNASYNITNALPVGADVAIAAIMTNGRIDSFSAFHTLSNGTQVLPQMRFFTTDPSKPLLSSSAALVGPGAATRVLIQHLDGSVTITDGSAQGLEPTQSFDIAIHTGMNLIANQLDHGSNTLNEIMPAVPNGCVLYKYENPSGTWKQASFFDVWTELPASITLSPGEGAFLQSPTDFTLTITGHPHVPVLPVSIPAGATYLLSRQTNDVGTYENITGTSPVAGATVYTWNGAAYNMDYYDPDFGWASGTGPMVAVGEAIWIRPAGNGTPPNSSVNCPTNKTVECGSAWTFDDPTVTGPCGGTNANITVLTIVTNGAGCSQTNTCTWQVSDTCGGSTQCSQTVTVVDTLPPVMSFTSFTVQCDDTWVIPPATAYDACCGTNVTLSLLSVVTNGGPCPDQEVISQVWQATDCCSNSTTCTQVVTVLPANVIAVTEGGSVTLTTPVLVDGASYQWLLDGTNIFGATGSSLDITNVQAPDLGNYAVLVASPLGVLNFHWGLTFKPCIGNQCAHFNTGMTGLNGNVPLAAGTLDPNYALVSWPAGAGTTAVVEGTLPAVWMPNSAGSQWIGPGLNTSQSPPGVYHYQLQFSLCCTNHATLGGRIAVDDTLGLYLNGQPKGTAASYSAWTPVSINSGFVLGYNVLDIYVTNAIIWTGLRAELTVCASCGCDPVPDNLVLWLPFDETSGATALNLAPGGNSGTKINSPTINGGYVVRSLCFDGASQYVAVPDYAAINVGANEDFSIDAWVKRDPASGNTVRIIADKRDPVSGAGYSLSISYGNLIFQLADAFGYTNYRDTGTVPADGQWHFVAVTVIRTLTTGGHFYVDGVATGTFDPTGHPNSLANTAPFQVAASLVAGNLPWLGCIDEVEMFKRALTMAEVQGIFSAGSAGKCKCVPAPSNLMLWLPFDETNGPTAANLAPGGNNGTEINSPAINNGYVVRSLCFDGVSQYVAVPDYAGINAGANQNFSLDAWVKRSFTNDSPPSVIVDKRDPTSGAGYSLALSYGNLIFQMGDPGYTNYRDTGTVPADGQWHFVAVTVNRALTNGGRFYIDGTATGTFDPTSHPNSLVNPSPFLVGTTPLGGATSWLGCIDEVEFFLRAITAQEVQGIFNARTAGKCKTNCAGGLVLTCTTNKTVECGSQWAFDAPAASSCCGTNITLTFSTVSNGACPQVITRTWTASDLCGNTNTCTQTVTVVDTTPPVFGLPGDKTVECGTSWTFDTPQVLDTCCGQNVTLVVVSTVTNGTAPCSLVITRTWRATDCCGNSATNHQTVTVRDITPPVFATSCVTNVIFAGGGNNFTTPVAASPSPGLLTRLHKAGITQFKGFDQCTVNTYFAHTFTNLPHCITAATLTVRLKPCGDYCLNDAIGLSFTSASGVLQTNGSWGSYLGSGNPSAGLDSDNWCNHTSGQTFVLNLAALPGTGANLLAQLNANGYLDFTCQDDTGVDYLQLNVTSCCYQPNKTVECGSQWTFDPPTASDACCGNNVTVSVFSTVTNGICPKVATRTWKATDCCGNSSFFSQIVTMVDTTPPVVHCPGPITRYTCSNSVPVYYSVWAYDACSGYRPVTCTPPSGHVFPVGTTIVHCTATDACGNVGTCSFTVTVVNQTLYASTMLGIPDCFKLPTEAAPKSGQLLAAYPGACWRPFDNLGVNCDFGVSFMGLPANLTCGQLWIRMRPNCSDIPWNDSISVGLNTNKTWGWTSYIGGGNGSPGLTSATWCGQGGCGQLFNMNLASMPNTGANLLPIINAAGSHKLDIFVQDDTGVDYAQLNYCYCRTLPWWQGWEWTTANAALATADTYASFSPLWSPGYPTNFSVTLAPGATHGIQLGLMPLNIGAVPGSSLTLSGQTTLDPSASAVTLTGDGSGTTSIALSAVRSNMTQVQLVFRLAGAVVSQATLPATLGSSLVSVSGGASLRAIMIQDDLVVPGTASPGDQYVVSLDGAYSIQCPSCPPPPVMADEIDVVLPVPSDTADNLLSSLTVSASGLTEIQVSSAGAEVSGVYPQVTGDAVASAGGDQLTITPSDPTSTNGMGFQIAVPASQAGASGFGLQVSQNLNAPPMESNGVVNVVITGQIGADVVPAIAVSAGQGAEHWAISADFSALSPTSVSYAIKDQGVKVAELTFTGTPHVPVLPTSWSVSANPTAPSVTLSWPEAQTITLGGTNYTGDELDITAVSPDLPLTAITAMQVQASGVDALTLSSIGPPALVWVLQPPLITPSQMTIQWSGPAGGTLESAPSVLGPWTPVPGQGTNSAVLASPMTNGVPVQFFRVRTN
jgi:hypothetical protein